MTHIVFATCNASPEIQPSDGVVRDALRARGVNIDVAPWNGPRAAFDDADAVVLRSTWDYQYAPVAFQDWLSQCARSGVVLNPLPVVRWNLSKNYLLSLAEQGAPLPPTCAVAPDAAAIAAMMDEMDLSIAVVKPEFGATSSGLSVIERADGAAIEAAAKSLAMPGIMQPLLSEISVRGETSLVFIDGEFTHAVTKRPKSGEIRCQKEFGGVSEPGEPPVWAVAEAQRILKMAPGQPVYARVDAIILDDTLQLMELELIEPELFFTYSHEAADRFAAALMKRL